MSRPCVQANNNANADRISISIKGQDGSKVVCKIPRKAKLIKVMQTYCQKKQLEFRTARFLLNGHRVLGKHSADKLNMEDGDEILCAFQQHGGGFYMMPRTT